MQTQSTQAWRFNSLFEDRSIEDAVIKASEMERERSRWSQMPLIEELYSAGWKEWQHMPGAQVVQDLVTWENEMNREHKRDPYYPRAHSCQYVWRGEVSKDQLRQIELRRFGSAENGGPTTYFSAVKAHLEGNRELRELCAWWQFDEETHKEMLKYVLTKYFGFEESQLYQVANKQREGLMKEPINQIDINDIRTVSRFSAMRDGPAILAGAMMLLERENVWTNQLTAKAYRDHYGLSNDARMFINVHTYIDLFHVKLGEYIVGKYVVTKEQGELIRGLYQNQKLTQMERSREFYDGLYKGKALEITNRDIDGNMG